MSTMTDQEAQVTEIPPAIVRDIAQARPEPGGFRERFPEEQPELDEFIEDVLEAEGEVAVEFCRRLAAALWAMYDEAFDEPLSSVSRARLEVFFPIARRIVGSFEAHHPNEPFDPEWLIEMPRGAQPHVIGFLIGALRAARFDIEAQAIFEITIVLLAVAGGLEETAITPTRTT